MAERRMIAKSVWKSDEFLDLTDSAKALYGFLILESDDDGFLTGGVKSILRMTAIPAEHIEELIENGFLYRFQNGKLLILDWPSQNRVAETRRAKKEPEPEMEYVSISADGRRYATEETCMQNVDNLYTSRIQNDLQYSLVKDSSGKNSKEQENLVKEKSKQGSEATVECAELENLPLAETVERYGGLYIEDFNGFPTKTDVAQLTKLFQDRGFDADGAKAVLSHKQTLEQLVDNIIGCDFEGN